MPCPWSSAERRWDGIGAILLGVSLAALATPAMADDGVRSAHFEPPDAWRGDPIRFEVELDQSALGAQELPWIEVLSEHGELVREAPLDRVASTGSMTLLGATVALDRQGRTRYRVVARGPERSRVVLGHAGGLPGPRVLARTLYLDVEPPGPLWLAPGQRDLLVRLDAEARGGDDNLDFAWRMPGGQWSAGRTLLTRLPAGEHAIEARVVDGVGNGQQVQVGVVIRPSPAGGEPGVEVDVRLPECQPRRHQSCRAVLTARPVGELTPPLSYTWQPDVSEPAAPRAGPTLEHDYGIGRPVARVRLTDAAGRTVTRDVPLTLRGIRVAAAPPAVEVASAPPAFAEALAARGERALLDGSAQLAVVRGDALARLEAPGPVTAAAICRARRAARDEAAALGHGAAWDGVFCVRVAPAADEGLTVHLRLFGLAGEPDVGTRVACGAADDACLTRVEALTRQLARGAKSWAVLAPAPDPQVRPTAPLRVTADAPDTRVWLNGADVGPAPRTLNLSVGVPFVVELESPNCPGRSRHDVTLAPGERRYVRGALCTPGALITIGSDPPGSTVLIDGHAVSVAGALVEHARPRDSRVTPIDKLPITSGRHEITVMHTGYVTYQEWITIEPGEHVTLNAPLKRLDGTLRVRNRGLSRFLYVDGVARGVLGAGQSRVFGRLSPGAHRICVHHRDTVDLAGARCETIELPSGLDVEFAERSPPLEPYEAPVATAARPTPEGAPLRLGASVELAYTLSTKESRLWVDGDTVIGAGLVLEDLETPLLPVTVSLGYRYGEGDTIRPMTDAELPSTVQHHQVLASGYVQLPLANAALGFGARGVLSYFDETINPGRAHRTRDTAWGFSLGPAVRLRVLGDPTSTVGIYGEYQYLLVLGPHDAADRNGQVHQAGLTMALFW